MDWWQIALVVLLSIVIGLLAGGLLSYLIARLLGKPFPMKLKMPALVEARAGFTAPPLVQEVKSSPKVTTEPWTEKFLPVETAAPALVQEVEGSPEVTPEPSSDKSLPLESAASTLLEEVENNRRIVTGPWTGEFVPFQTDVWDTSGDEFNNTLPAGLREDLTQAYVDMHLGNSIVWLSAEIGCSSQNLEEKYTKLRTSIAARFDRIMPLLKESGN